jgi:hypothetical protein
MKKAHRPLRKALTLIAVVGAIGGSYALAGSNSFGTSAGGAAGSGSGAISGYTIGTPAYTLLASDPSKIGSFSFTISPVTASTALKAGVVSGAFADSCTLGTITSGSATATCSYNSGNEPAVTAATSLTVVGAN